MKHWMKYIVLMLTISMGACSSEGDAPEEQITSENNEITEIVAEIGAFQTEGLISRTVINMGESSITKPVWADKDTIGIYPTTGDQLSFPIIDGIGTSTCSFTGGGWGLKTSTTYTAYSPFNRGYYYKDNNKLPISMLGQKQTGNDNTSHLGKYDLQIAKGTTPESGKVKFSFERQICFIRMDLIAPVAATWKSITLGSDAAFTTKATMDFTLEAPVLTTTDVANNVTLELENVKTEAGDSITAYMVVLPIDLTGKTLHVTLTDVDNNTFTKEAVIANDYRNFKAGYARWISSTDFPDDTTEIPYVTFTAESGQTLTMSKAVETLEYSVNDGEWAELGTTTVLFGGENGNLRLRGKNGNGTDGAQIKFGNAAPVACTGDIRTLLDYENYITITNSGNFASLFNGCSVLTSAPELPTTLLSARCYEYMFKNCTNLATAPKLPATSLATECYSGMFWGCKSLISTPALPAVELTDYCYNYMFSECISLKTPPKLPATTLANFCYRNMFYGCTGLTSAPELPATTLANACYDNMFNGCTSLTTAPQLPATTLANSCYHFMFGNTSLTSTPELQATTLASGCYSNMFNGCKSLTTAPELPATILTSNCYEGMFSGCTSLTTTPELPATAMASYCYYSMFQECTGLTTATELQAEILAEYCYGEMFKGCTNLTTAPKLPATTLANGCYSSMFSTCGNLTKAPELPATILAESCYFAMFVGCSNLTTAPELPATTLVPSCYKRMFKNCKKLNSVTMLATDISASDCLYEWMLYITTTGIFTKAATMTSLPEGASGIPAGWEVKDYGATEEVDNTPYVTFTADAAQTLTMTKAVETLEYSVGNGDWATLGTTTVTFGGDNGTLRLRGKSSIGTATSTDDYSKIVFGNIVSVACSGDIRTLVDYENYASTSTENARFCYLFNGLTDLTSAPELPATTLADYCYYSMFRDCSNLSTPPELPAMNLASYCYGYMFSGCSGLTSAPELPAMNLADYCYGNMFVSCTSLATAPELPATNLADWCYQYMFWGCTKLITGPSIIPASTMKRSSCLNMFYNCLSLTTAPKLPATNLDSGCYFQMFIHCQSLTVAPELPATTLAESCYQNMFCYCISLTESPILPAKTLVKDCYYTMFSYCSNLRKVTMLATDISATDCLNNWLYSASSSGLIYKSKDMTSLPEGANGIPTGWATVDFEE